MSASQQLVQSTRFRQQQRRALAATIVFACLASCSLQDFDKLGPGKRNAGGSAGRGGGGKNGNSGASTTEAGVSGSTSVGGTESGGTADGSAGLAASAATAGSGEAAGAEGVGGSTSQAGADGASGNTSQAGATGAICGVGLSSCPGEPECTTDLATGTPFGTTVKHCGTCATTCSLSNATSVACASGQCMPTCTAGFLDCNATTKDDGCEANVNGLANCGTTCANAVACPATQVCNAGACGAPHGLVVFTVPLTATGLKQRFADKFPTKPDLTNGTLTVRLYAPGATSGEVNIYASDSDFSGGNGALVELNALSAGWVDVKVSIGGVLGTFDPSVVTQLNLEIGSTGVGPWLNPTIIYVDSTWSSNGAINDTFDATLGNMVGSSTMKIDGSTVAWTGSMP